jgi:3-phosphoshikimate 1-carboxyvinyltransferase
MINNSSLVFNKIDSIAPVSIRLTTSKSISNRALIIAALCDEDSQLMNLAAARDTQLMKRLLPEPAETIDVMDAGTTMRFLTGYFALSGKTKILTGTPRMQERPIGILVEALKEIGADIEYLGKQGFPPHKTLGFNQQKTNEITIPGDISSQYISSLLMMAPTLPKGLTIIMTGRVMSRPYIEMTLGIMDRFGVKHEWLENKIKIPNQSYQATTFKVEADWSAASYWYSLVALSNDVEVKLEGLESNSLQGDRQIVDIMQHLGVQTEFHHHGLLLTRGELTEEPLVWDFSSCPDLAPTVMATCTALGVPCQATGLESLRIKETDRIAALQNELGKVGAMLDEHDGHWSLSPPTDPDWSQTVYFDTYDDHRMAMALAPLALRLAVVIDDPEVVNKSYPNFWKDLEKAGLQGTRQQPFISE